MTPAALCCGKTQEGVLTMEDKLVTIAELSDQLGGLSRASIYRHIKDLPHFPKPVKVGAATRFLLSDVQEFIAKSGQAAGEVNK